MLYHKYIQLITEHHFTKRTEDEDMSSTLYSETITFYNKTHSQRTFDADYWICVVYGDMLLLVDMFLLGYVFARICFAWICLLVDMFDMVQFE